MDLPEPKLLPTVLLIAASLLFHVVLFLLGAPLLESLRRPEWDRPVAITLLDGDMDFVSDPSMLPEALLPEGEEVVEPEPEPEEPELPDGQVVDIPPPADSKRPLTADYLAEHDVSVPEETRTAAFKINPEVLSNIYSRESKVALEEVADVGATEQSTGATAGGADDVALGKGPPRTSIPSQWTVTNKEGIAGPVMASSRSQSIAGAPQNDLLNEKVGDRVAINAREFAGASYINRIKRQVSFYWEQNLDNLPGTLRISKSHYATVVAVVLDENGALETIEVTDESGLVQLDAAVINAFRTAGPFPNPPEQLVARDGRVYLEDLGFDVNFGHASMQYQGVDPRSGVQFPGIMKNPR